MPGGDRLTGIVESFRRKWRFVVTIASSPVAMELGVVGEWGRLDEGYI